MHTLNPARQELLIGTGLKNRCLLTRWHFRCRAAETF